MTWTPISKPTVSDWSNTNPSGRTQYDQSNVTYDDANVFYDGIDTTAWTDVVKPILPITYTGEASGLLIPLTFTSSVIGTDWTLISKPSI